MNIVHRARIRVVLVVEIFAADKVYVLIAVFQCVFVSCADYGKTCFAVLTLDPIIGSWSPKRLNDPGDQDVTVTYGGKSAAVQVSVQPHPITEFAVFVTGHNGVPVDGEERLRDFTFDTSAMAPGDVRTLGLKITGRVTGGLTSALILDSFASTQVAVGDVPDLARHVAITISCEGEELTSITLDRLWDGHVLDLGPVPEDGLDVELSIGLLHTGDTMRQSLSFGLAVWGYSEADI